MEANGSAIGGSDRHAIAVVGMACRFPGEATDIEAFWEMLCNAKDAWSEIPSDRFNTKGWYHPNPNRPGSFHIRGAHFIKGDVAAFDAPFFSISTAEAVSMDPQQRLLLEVVYESLDSAGIPVLSLASSATSVFCGSFVRDYEQPCMRDPDTTPPYSATGNGIAILANRVSHAFDFAGTSQTIDTGCSASMIAVHQACKSLIDGESCLGIAAGVGLIFSPNTLVPMANLNILSPDGRCFTFDKRANGYGRGEGIGVLVLKRLEDAIADNDTIRAVIRATSSNQDGHTQGITLPSKTRQIQNMSQIYRNAGLDTTRTAYIECHGTGTQAGDLKEAQAVHEVFCRQRTPENPLIIGSVKTNIGHLEGGAGVAGLLKGILVAERGYIPKHLNFISANPNIDFDIMKMRVAAELTPWPVPGLRRVSVNSFGFGGTNSHVILDDAPHFLAESHITGGQHSSFLFPGDELSVETAEVFCRPQNRLFVFSGHDEAGLHRVLDTQAHYVEKHTRTSPDFEPNYAYTLISRRSALSWRTYIVAATANELFQRLQDKATATPFRTLPHSPSRLALIFCGQGAQWFAMGRELLTYSVFCSSVSAASRHMSTVLGSPFDLWDELQRDRASSRIDEPQIAQPATTVIQMALVDLLTASGLHPTAVVGHSSGEIAAAYAASAVRREDAWKIAYQRGQCVARIATLAPGMHGGMLAVPLSESDARRSLADAGITSVDVACINGPASVTVSGDVDGIVQLHGFFARNGVRAVPVKVGTAYHSYHMRVVEEMYRESIQDITPLSSMSPCMFFSSVLGRKASVQELDANYWVKNLVLPVQFYQASEAMIRQAAPDALLEVSPRRVWESTLLQICSESGDSRPLYLSLLHREQDASVTMLNAIGELWMRGIPLSLDWALASDAKKPRHLVDVPSYPWDHSRKYWHESHLSRANRFRAHGREDIIGAPLENSTPQFPRWRGFFRVQENPWLEDHVVQKSIIYPAGGMAAMAIEAAKQLADPRHQALGYEVTDFVITKPMIIPTTPQGLENMLSAQRVESDEECSAGIKDKASYDFSVLSKPEDGPWTTHATGRLAILYGKRGFDPITAKALRNELDCIEETCSTSFVPRQFYESLDVTGMSYGPQFRNIVELRRGVTAACSVIQIPDTKARMPFQFEYDHIIHPVTLDTMVQTVLSLSSSSDDDEAMLPCSAGRIFVSATLPKGAGACFRGYTKAEKTSTRSARAEIVMFDDRAEAPAVIFDKLVFKSMPRQTSAGIREFLPSHRNLCSEIIWKTDISSIVSLGTGFPKSAEELVDLAAHRNPALSLLHHVQGHAKCIHIPFTLLAAAQETPRFAQCVISGPEELRKHVRKNCGSHPGLERLRFSDGIPADGQYDVVSVLCSFDGSDADANNDCSEDNLARFGRCVSPGGWLAFTSKTNQKVGPARQQELRKSLEAIGFQADNNPGDATGFFAVQKRPGAMSRETKRSRVMLLLPDEASSFVTALKNTIRPILEQELSAEVCEVSFAQLSALPREDVRIHCLSLIEIDSALIYAMEADAFDAVHRLLMLTRGLVWLTRSAQLDTKTPLQSPFVGLARTLRSEDAKKKIVSLDLDVSNDDGTAIPSCLVRSIAMLFKSVCATTRSCTAFAEDVEFAYSDGQLKVPRLVLLPTLNRLIEHGPSAPELVVQVPFKTKNAALKLDISSVSKASGPLFVEDNETKRRPLLADEIRIAVAGTNLMPEDIALAVQGTPSAAMGTDVFGYVVETGFNVKHMPPYCRVVARMRDTIRTHAITHKSRVRRVDHQGEWRRSCPTAFATAMYAFQTSRPISKGDVVLIYGAATAYGQAATRLAVALGAQVLVACSTVAEKKFLSETLLVFGDHVLDLQHGEEQFESQLRVLTGHRGVDVVFDPTSRHIEQGFRCVAECGRVVRVAWNGAGSSQMRIPAKNVSFETVDLDLLEARRPHEAERLARSVDWMLQLAPSLDIVNGAEEHNMCGIQEALEQAAARLFAAPHALVTDSDTLCMNKVSMSVRLTHKTELSPSATYLLIGGLGGLGRSIAEHLVERGARHMAFFSRSGASGDAAQAFLAQLAGQGVEARAFAVDICDKAQLAAAVKEVHGIIMPAIQGAIQCAAVVDDAAFSSMDYGRWKRSFAPKTAGSFHLHELLPRDMDFFVFLSSSSGVIGNRGQANYAAGNSFQDALARHRSAQGMHSVSIDFGLVLGAGMVAENECLLDAMRASGFFGVRLHDALYILDRAMAKPGTEDGVGTPAQIVTTVGTGGLILQNKPSDPFWARAALFRYLNQVDAPPHGLRRGRDGSGGDLRAAIQGAGSPEAAAQAVVAGLIATVARRKSMMPEDFSADQMLSSYGIDSLDAISVLGWIARETGMAVQTVEGVTIGELGRDVAARTLAALEEEQ